MRAACDRVPVLGLLCVSAVDWASELRTGSCGRWRVGHATAACPTGRARHDGRRVSQPMAREQSERTSAGLRQLGWPILLVVASHRRFRTTLLAVLNHYTCKGRINITSFVPNTSVSAPWFLVLNDERAWSH